MQTPLADRLRPQTLDEVVGQEHILSADKVLRRIIEGGTLPNLIFYGPSGVGKTTVARIIAQKSGKRLHKLNATSISTADIKDVIAETGSLLGSDGIILYLDEIQYLNKKQQQVLLECIENGSLTLIASTTENPYFYVYNAILSRSTVFEFKPVTPEAIGKAVDRAFSMVMSEYGRELAVCDGVREKIASSCGGDVRKAINSVELLSLSALTLEKPIITLEDAAAVSQRSNLRYDRDADEHYDILSGFQKSIRGSDENAALHYLARLIEAGDLISICRRLLVIAAEDIGLAYPMAIAIVKACADTARELGFPEAALPLSEAVILLCTAPKSNSASEAIGPALDDVRNTAFGEIPAYLRDAHYKGAAKLGRGLDYKYPHDYPNHYIKQQYLPDALKDRVYYRFGDNKAEQAALAYRKAISG